jgi:hypothetical protein
VPDAATVPASEAGGRGEVRLLRHPGSEFRPIFTAPSFQNFCLLVCGFVHALGQHRMTNALRAVGPLASKHFTTYYRFVSRARWSIDELGLAFLAVVLGAFGSPVLVRLVLDDTLTHRTGKKVALATSHADPVLEQSDGRPFVSYGHVFVVLSIHVSATWMASTGWALPFLFRLFEGSKQGGKLDRPSDQRRARGRRQAGKTPRRRVRLRDQKVVGGKLVHGESEPDTGPLPDEGRPTKLQLATAMILLVARRFPNVQFRVLADHLYTGEAVLNGVHSQVSNVHFIMRGRPDAALFALPPPKEKRRGRPRVKGEQLPCPEIWAKSHPEAFRRATIPMYGKSVEVELASYLGMPYRSLPGRLVRYVIVRDPQRIYQPAYLFCTDPRVPDTEVVEEYARRWSLEVAFEASKQKLGIEHPRTQLPGAVRRSAPFGMLLYSLTVLWYLRDGCRLTASATLRPDPWYPKTARPSFADMLACLRRASWSQWFSDPSCNTAERQQILADYLDRVVASG